MGAPPRSVSLTVSDMPGRRGWWATLCGVGVGGVVVVVWFSFFVVVENWLVLLAIMSIQYIVVVPRLFNFPNAFGVLVRFGVSAKRCAHTL